MQAHATANEVEQSEKLGQQLGVEETPAMFINGRLLSGALPWPTLQSVIKVELDRPADIEAPSAVHGGTETGKSAPTAR